MPCGAKILAASRAIEPRQSTNVPKTSNSSALMDCITYPQNRWISLCKKRSDLTGRAEICHVVRRDHKMITLRPDPVPAHSRCRAERYVPSARTAVGAEMT